MGLLSTITEQTRLDEWQGKLARCETAYAAERKKMDFREELYTGSKRITAPDGGEAKNATHVRNVVSEIIESQVQSSIPQPKVSAIRQQDEERAKLIENMLRNELDRLPFEVLNDMDERTCPIQGGSFFLVEWDAAATGAGRMGELAIRAIHPKNVVPQDGVFSSVEDMDYVFILVPQTKAYIKRRYGIDVEEDAETHPEVRGMAISNADDMVTQVMAYYRNDEGGIGLFSWVSDKVLIDMEDYQARQILTCKKCGQPGNGRKCAYCDGKSFESEVLKEEEMTQDMMLSSGDIIPASIPLYDPMSFYAQEQQNSIPYYKPNTYPLILRRNVSMHGRLLGDSDVDKIEDQQNSMKKLSTKINEKLLKGGSVLIRPKNVQVRPTDEELKVAEIDNPQQREMFSVVNLQADVSADMAYLNHLYEEARQITGITESYQGRRDTTATSGRAKEIAAAQTAGRLESKRVMKEAAYAALFEVMFKFVLAYADEQRDVVSTDHQGTVKHDAFNRYDFLELDDAGEPIWADRFLFSCDVSATLSQNRQAMWEETRANLMQGAYGNPQDPATLAFYWSRMEQLHYPGAADAKTYFENMIQQQMEQQQQMMMQQPQMQGQMPMQMPQEQPQMMQQDLPPMQDIITQGQMDQLLGGMPPMGMMG